MSLDVTLPSPVDEYLLCPVLLSHHRNSTDFRRHFGVCIQQLFLWLIPVVARILFNTQTCIFFHIALNLSLNGRSVSRITAWIHFSLLYSVCSLFAVKLISFFQGLSTLEELVFITQSLAISVLNFVVFFLKTFNLHILILPELPPSPLKCA